MHRVGQSHAYTVYIRHFWQENHHIYGHIRRLYTVYGPGQPYTCTNHKNAGHKGSEFCRSTNRRPMLTDSLLFIKALMHVPFKLQGFNKVIEMQRMIDGCNSGLRSLVASIRSTEDLVKLSAQVGVSAQ